MSVVNFRYRRRCCRRAGAALTALCARVAASHTTRAGSSSATSATSAITSTASTRHSMPYRRAPGSASGALAVLRAARRCQALAASGRTTTRSVAHAPVSPSARLAGAITTRANLSSNVPTARGRPDLFHQCLRSVYCLKTNKSCDYKKIYEIISIIFDLPINFSVFLCIIEGSNFQDIQIINMLYIKLCKYPIRLIKYIYLNYSCG